MPEIMERHPRQRGAFKKRLEVLRLIAISLHG